VGTRVGFQVITYHDGDDVTDPETDDADHEDQIVSEPASTGSIVSSCHHEARVPA
jgi:hypothetical protein